MLSRAKKVSREVAKLPSIPKELVKLFLTGPMTGEAVNAAGIAFKKALIEASLNAELSHHLGYVRARFGQTRTGEQPSQREHEQDGADGGWQAADRDAA